MSPTPQNSSDREKMRCTACSHGKCDVCKFCHNMDCSTFIRPFNSCYCALIPSPSPSVEKKCCDKCYYCVTPQGNNISVPLCNNIACECHKMLCSSPKSEVSGEWKRELRVAFYKFLQDDELQNEDIFAWLLETISSQRQSLEREHREWKERIVKKIVDMRQDEHPTEDGVPVETHGYEETYNSALEQVKHLLLNE